MNVKKQKSLALGGLIRLYLYNRPETSELVSRAKPGASSQALC